MSVSVCCSVCVSRSRLCVGEGHGLAPFLAENDARGSPNTRMHFAFCSFTLQIGARAVCAIDPHPVLMWGFR